MVKRFGSRILFQIGIFAFSLTRPVNAALLLYGEHIGVWSVGTRPGGVRVI